MGVLRLESLKPLMPCIVSSLTFVKVQEYLNMHIQQKCCTHTQPTIEQADALQEAFLNCTSARQHGIHFNGATYKCVRADKESIYAKKVIIL